MLAQNIPWLIGGSADLAPSTKTRLTFAEPAISSRPSYGGRNFHFGIREHAMGAILNGMALSKMRPYGSGFLIFSDYCKPSDPPCSHHGNPGRSRIFTHDSIGVGEDGPTHQPIEQLVSLRAIPGLITLRPCDANEVVEAWKLIMKLHHEPVGIGADAASRCRRSTARKYAAASGWRRALTFWRTRRRQAGGIIAGDRQRSVARAWTYTSSSRRRRNSSARGEYAVMGAVRSSAGRVSRQRAAAGRDRASCGGAGDRRWAGAIMSACAARAIGMATFGASAPLKELQKKFGFTPEKVMEAAKRQLAKAKAGKPLR